jgi:hypothetical protein
MSQKLLSYVVVTQQNPRVARFPCTSKTKGDYKQYGRGGGLDIPDIVDEPPTPVPELRLPVEAVSPPELAIPIVAAVDEDIKTVGIAEPPVTDVAAPELEACAAEDVELG